MFTIEPHLPDDEMATLVCADPDGAGDGRTRRFPVRWLSRGKTAWTVEIHHENGAGLLLMADSGDLSVTEVYAAVIVVRAGAVSMPRHPLGHTPWPGVISHTALKNPVGPTICAAPAIDSDWWTACPAGATSSWEGCEAWWVAQVLIPMVGRGSVIPVESIEHRPSTLVAKQGKGWSLWK